MEQVAGVDQPAHRARRRQQQDRRSAFYGDSPIAGAGALAFDGRVSDSDKPTPQAAPLDAKRMITLMRLVAEERDREAFAELFAHFAPRLKSYLMRQGAGAEPAEELAQEAMIMVWRKAASFDANQAAVSTWIFRIARNKQIDALRREKRPDIDWTDPALQPDHPEEADKGLETAQQEDRIRAALKALPEEQAEMVRMAFFEDQAHSSIAETAGLPLGTVKSRLRLALGKLRAQLEKDEEL